MLGSPGNCGIVVDEQSVASSERGQEELIVRLLRTTNTSTPPPYIDVGTRQDVRPSVVSLRHLPSTQPPSHSLFSHPPPLSTMASTPQQPEGRGLVLPTLDVFIQVLNIAKDSCGIPPAQIAFGSASVLLTMIRVCLTPASRRQTSDSYLSRTQWLTIRTASTSGGLAVTCAKCSTGD